MMQHDELDRVIDQALADYVPQPRPGLEKRVLANAHTDGGIARVLGLRWNLVAGVAACLLIAALVFVGPRRKAKTVHVIVAQNAPSAQTNIGQESVRIPTKTMPVRRRKRTRVRNVVEPLPKLRELPSPALVLADPIRIEKVQIQELDTAPIEMKSRA